jgi:hypothetical protein
MSEFAAGPISKTTFSRDDPRDPVNSRKKPKLAPCQTTPAQHSTESAEPDEEAKHQLDVEV